MEFTEPQGRNCKKSSTVLNLVRNLVWSRFATWFETLGYALQTQALNEFQACQATRLHTGPKEYSRFSVRLLLERGFRTGLKPGSNSSFQVESGFQCGATSGLLHATRLGLSTSARNRKTRFSLGRGGANESEGINSRVMS